MSNFVDASGKPIADDQLESAFASGQLRALPGTRVNMVDSSGVPVTVPAESAGEAIAAGMRPEASSAVQARRTREEFGTVGQQALAGVEGAARGLSFGLSDVAATSIGGEKYRRNALARQQANPITAGASEVVGAVAPALLTLGGTAPESAASLTTRTLTAIPRAGEALGKAALPFATSETALGRMALRAAQTGIQGAFEGALYGAGSAAGQAALKGDEITAEKVLSGGAHGALIGGLLGASLGGLTGRFEKSASKAQAGDDMLLRAKLDKLDATLRKQGLADEKIAARVAEESARLERKSSLLDRFAAKQAVSSLKPGPRTLSRYAKAPAEVDDLIQEAGQDYLNYEMRTGPLAGKRIFHGAASPTDALDDISHAWQETDDILRAHKQTAAQTIAANPELAPNMSELAGRIESDIADKIGKSESRALAKHFAPMRQAQQGQLFGQVGQELDALEMTRQSLTDAIEGASKHGELRALRSARTAVDDTLNSATENALDRAGVDTTLFRNEARMHRSLSFVRDAAEELKLSQHADRGMHNDAAGYVLGTILSGHIGVGALTGLMTNQGRQFMTNRMGGIVADIANRVARSDYRMQWGAKALSGDGFRYPVRTAVTKSLTGPAAERFYQALGATASDPKRREDYVVARTQEYAAQYPQLAGAIQQKITGDLQYLAGHIPARMSRASASLTPTTSKPVGAKASAGDFWERVHALEDPGYVVDQLLNGRVPRAAIETLKERRPLEWEALRQGVIQECSARDKPLPFKRRITLGVAFEFPADKSLQPGTMSAIQASMMQMQGPGAPAQAAPSDQAGTVEAMSLPSDRSM